MGTPPYSTLLTNSKAGLTGALLIKSSTFQGLSITRTESQGPDPQGQGQGLTSLPQILDIHFKSAAHIRTCGGDLRRGVRKSKKERKKE